jgi:hypothetical protein
MRYRQRGAGSGADTIILPSGVYTLTLVEVWGCQSAGDLDINGDLTITGAGAALTRSWTPIASIGLADPRA